jgi:hypothetical protein
MKRKLEETEIILYHCHSGEYQILVHYDGEDNELYLAIHLSGRDFWR